MIWLLLLLLLFPILIENLRVLRYLLTDGLDVVQLLHEVVAVNQVFVEVASTRRTPLSAAVGTAAARGSVGHEAVVVFPTLTLRIRGNERKHFCRRHSLRAQGEKNGVSSLKAFFDKSIREVRPCCARNKRTSTSSDKKRQTTAPHPPPPCSAAGGGLDTRRRSPRPPPATAEAARAPGGGKLGPGSG